MLFLFLFFNSEHLNAQLKYTARVEYSSLQYGATVIRYETDRGNPNFLNSGVNGREINVVNGVLIKERGLIGFGLSYLDFNNINGLSTTLDFEYLPSKRKISPLLNFRYGRAYLKSQNNTNRGSALGGADIGINYKAFKALQVYVKGGAVFTHNASFFTWRGGLRF